MNALIAVDFTPASGLGHVRRGLAIGTTLARLGWSVTLANTASGEIVLGDSAGGITTLSGLDTGGLDSRGLRAEFDACVIDSYEASSELREDLAPYLAIDDYYLPLPGAIAVLNPAPGADTSRYQIDEKLIGADYALLGDDVLMARESCGEPGFPPRQVYVWLGAAGTSELMQTVRGALDLSLPEAEVLVPPAPVESAQSRAGTARPRAELAPAHSNFEGAAHFIAQADLVICAGGVTALEAACIGRPAVALVLAENQKANVAGLAHEGTLIEATGQTLEMEIRELTSDREKFAELASRGRKLVDGRGAERTAKTIVRIFSGSSGGSPHLG